jgi:hypothetical protein
MLAAAWHRRGVAAMKMVAAMKISEEENGIFKSQLSTRNVAK